MTEAEKYLNDFANLQKEYGIVEITFEGLCKHLEMFAYKEQERVKKINIDDVSNQRGLLIALMNKLCCNDPVEENEAYVDDFLSNL